MSLVACCNYPLIFRRLMKLALFTALFITPASMTAQQPAPAQPKLSDNKLADGISASEFARMIREMSESGGYFLSDNFTSNETSYLHIVDKLQQLGETGGAYIGVGPEQNFTYIAKLRPRIVFIVDIRRQAMIQHLMYKAIFQLSPTRTEFLSRLLSKPLPTETKDAKETAKEAAKEVSKEAGKPEAPKLVIPKPDAPVAEILAFFDKLQPSDQAYTANLAEIKKVIENDFQFPLSTNDKASLDYVYKNFRTDGLEIAFRMDSNWGNYFPTFRELIVQTDLRGKAGNFLAVPDDYNFVRELQRKNLIIPLVGDFGGSKALTSVGEYLHKNGLTVSAYYLSNVEQYLFDGTSFEGFAKNVKKLPLTDKSLFIRSVFNMRYAHPATLPGHLSTTLLQQMTVFLKDYDAGLYRSYGDVIFNHYIAAEKP